MAACLDAAHAARGRLLDEVVDVISDRSRWYEGAWAKDAQGERIEGPVLAAVESERTARRCVFGELVHQGLRRGYGLELAVEPDDE